ncbi:MAG: hypothetical protein MJ091_04835, partial [Clostridia bacterium]|nr:hypothetical protein [Clostridia bacterium]
FFFFCIKQGVIIGFVGISFIFIDYIIQGILLNNFTFAVYDTNINKVSFFTVASTFFIKLHL